jgi:hypothetical protein
VTYRLLMASLVSCSVERMDWSVTLSFRLLCMDLGVASKCLMWQSWSEFAPIVSRLHTLVMSALCLVGVTMKGAMHCA